MKKPKEKVGISHSNFKFLTHKLDFLRGKSVSSDCFGSPHGRFHKCSWPTNTNHSCLRFAIQHHAFKLHEKAIPRFHKAAYMQYLTGRVCSSVKELKTRCPVPVCVLAGTTWTNARLNQAIITLELVNHIMG